MSARDADPVRPYRRPQWTGRPMVFSDGSPDYEFSQCPSCLAFHHERSKSCNGKREPWPIQCAAALGEVQCQRPGNHLGPHEAESESMRMEWEPKGTHIDGSQEGS